MSAMSRRQVRLVLELYKADGRIDDFSVEVRSGTPHWKVFSKHLPDGQQEFTRAALVQWLRSIGSLV